jgi:glucose/arabinose dehydrogenase
MGKKIAIVIAVAAVLAAGLYFFKTRQPQGGQTNLTPIPATNTNPAGGEKVEVEVVAKDLNVPWDIVFLPDGDLLVTERSGTLRRFGKNPATIDIPSVKHSGEGGLMGIALHPQFADNQFVYLYFTVEGSPMNRIARFKLEGDELKFDKTIIENIPSALYHDGGQIAFGPDGMLYATTGDAEVKENAQNLKSLAGKTLRLTPDGDIPSDNPFGTAVWSYGHRNAQGIAWDDRGRMWQTEHGRSGALSGLDELNMVEKGKNYGWPTIQGDQTRDGMVTPVRNSGGFETWAPSGIAYLDGSLFFAGLRGSTLYEVKLDADGKVTDFKKRYTDTYGRLRAVVTGPDGYLYVTTSNRDGRGTVRDGDDKILKILP